MARRSKKAVKKNLLKFSVIFAMYVAIWIFLMTVAVVVSVPRAVSVDDKKSAIPVMEISLNEVTLQEVHENGKEVKYAGNTLSLDGVNYENVEFKGRGNFSWVADKKSYRIKFDKKVELLGMGKAKKWALIANGVDNSLLRNDLAYFIMQELVGKTQVRGEFVDLVVDGENLGVYYVIRTMEIDKQTIDLRDKNGVLAELDNVYCGAEDKRYIANNGDCFTVKDIVTVDNQEKVMEDFIKQYDEFLEALDDNDYEEIARLIDVESFAKYFVISEFTSNPDAYITSWFMYKDGVDDRIHAGLAWDFDAALGNREWGDFPEGFYEPTAKLGRFEYTYMKNGSDRICSYNKNKTLRETADVSLAMCHLLDVPEFRSLVGDIYERELFNKREVVLNYLSKRASEIAEAAKDDAVLWNKGDFDAEIEYLRQWLEARFDWFKETW